VEEPRREIGRERLVVLDEGCECVGDDLIYIGKSQISPTITVYPVS
jgi:hypothetical protein